MLLDQVYSFGLSDVQLFITDANNFFFFYLKHVKKYLKFLIFLVFVLQNRIIAENKTPQIVLYL